MFGGIMRVDIQWTRLLQHRVHWKIIRSVDHRDRQFSGMPTLKNDMKRDKIKIKMMPKYWVEFFWEKECLNLDVWRAPKKKKEKNF